MLTKLQRLNSVKSEEIVIAAPEKKPECKQLTVTQQQEQRRIILALYLQSRGHRALSPVVKTVDKSNEEVKEAPVRHLYEQGDSPPYEAARKKKKVKISVEMNDILPHDGSGEEEEPIRSLNNDLSHL